MTTFAHVRQAQQRLEDQEQALQRARDQVEATAHAYAAQAAGSDDPQIRSDALNELYWLVPEVKVADLEQIFGLRPSTCRQTVGAGPAIASCIDCGADIHPTSRTEAAELRQRSGRQQRRPVWRDGALVGLLCDPCETRARQDRDVVWAQAHQQRRERIEALLAMPLDQYLLQPEAIERTRWVLEHDQGGGAEPVACMFCDPASARAATRTLAPARQHPLQALLLAACTPCSQEAERGGLMVDATAAG